VLFEPAELPAGFTMQTTLLGRVLADHKGRTLYARDGKSRGEPDPAWIPLEAPWLARPEGDWSTVPLPSGGRQWAFKGRALYLYEKDKDPQDLRGHALPGGWTAVVLEPAPPMPRWMTIQRVDLGWVFADAKGMTVYAPARPETIKAAQTCPDDCMKAYWRPVLAAADETSVGRWVITTNAAGQRQWSYEGRPLYTHTRDTKPGEMRGNAFAVGYNIGDGFRVILIDAALPAPGS
jgi:predicted lipoprotein with Yx(FWY)xxD motif